MGTTKTKTSKSTLNLTAIILVAITLILALMTIGNVAVYAAAEASMINRTTHNYSTFCVGNSTDQEEEVLEENLDETLDEGLDAPLDEEALNKNCAIRDDVWYLTDELGVRLIASEYHGTIAVLLAATLISFAIDMAYFSLLRK